MISRHELRLIMPFAGERADTYAEPLAETMVQFDISSPLRIAAFLAQLAHESGELRYVCELASGKAYEGRADLGNTEPGDGVTYKGHGLIQVTGKQNHFKCADWFGVAHDEIVEWLMSPRGASLSAGWFWYTKKLNALADKKDFRQITRVINGGYNGLDDRLKYYTRALDVLGAIA